MDYEVRLAEKARDDLSDIYTYIAIDLFAPMAAHAQLERLQEAIYSLAQYPERYRVYDHEPWRTRNLRVMPMNNYLIFYIPNTEERSVTIIRIMYGGRNIERRLGI